MGSWPGAAQLPGTPDHCHTRRTVRSLQWAGTRAARSTPACLPPRPTRSRPPGTRPRRHEPARQQSHAADEPPTETGANAAPIVPIRLSLGYKAHQTCHLGLVGHETGDAAAHGFAADHQVPGADLLDHGQQGLRRAGPLQRRVIRRPIHRTGATLRTVVASSEHHPAAHTPLTRSGFRPSRRRRCR